MLFVLHVLKAGEYQRKKSTHELILLGLVVAALLCVRVAEKVEIEGE